MRTIWGKAFATAGVLSLLAGAAQAKIVNITFSGVVYDSIDTLGEFGDAGMQLDGAAFVTTYRFDTTIGAADFTGEHSDVQGGSWLGWATPVLAASITINGHTISAPGSWFGEIYARFVDPVQFYVESSAASNHILFNYLEPGALGVGWATPDFADFDGDISDVPGYGGYYNGDASVSLIQQHLTISSEGAVPEPASWALMVGGFGLVGGAMRSRRRVSVSFG